MAKTETKGRGRPSKAQTGKAAKETAPQQKPATTEEAKPGDAISFAAHTGKAPAADPLPEVTPKKASEPTAAAKPAPDFFDDPATDVKKPTQQLLPPPAGAKTKQATKKPAATAERPPEAPNGYLYASHPNVEAPQLFNKVTWGLMGKDKAGWVEFVPTPPEAADL